MENKTDTGLTMDFLQAMMANEKKEKAERFRYLNAYAKKGAIVFAGSSLMEQFPIYEFLQDFDLPFTIYNRGIGGMTTEEMLGFLPECLYDLSPRAIFLNIGTNDLNDPSCSLRDLADRYEKILMGIQEHLPEAKLFMLAYYPVNPHVVTSPMLKELMKSRTNKKIREANALIKKLAEAYGAIWLDLNEAITDEEGCLKEELTVEGMHMYANGYRLILEQLLPVLASLLPKEESKE